MGGFEMEKEVKVTFKVTCGFSTSASCLCVSRLWQACVQPPGVSTGMESCGPCSARTPGSGLRLWVLLVGQGCI